MSTATKTAVVTGGARGLGRAMVEELLAQGYAVETWDLREGDALPSDRHTFRALDVADPAQVAAAAQAFVAAHGAPTALINNAGITRDALLHKMTPENFAATWKVNVEGTFLPTQILGSLMREEAARLQKDGRPQDVVPRRIVMISSVAGTYGNVGQANYAASKAAVVGFMKSVAKEWGRYGISAVAVAPGFMRTEMIDSIPAEIQKSFVERTPLRRMGTPQELAKFIAYLCAPDAAFLTGEVINFSGGLLL